MTDAGEDPATGRDTEPAIDVPTAVSYLRWGAIAALALLAVVAGVGLYTSLSELIDVWVAPRYRPPARAGLNFAVLCVSVAGVVGLLRRTRR
jgi:Ni/Fe-hydrogenase subunit HybB-like protein